MTSSEFSKWILGGLTEDEWKELVTLEYVLTWNYSDNFDVDEKRYLQLSKKCWAGRDLLTK